MKTLSRLQAICLAFVVTVIWSFSWVLIKIGLQDDIPPGMFAALRYGFAALMLFGVILVSRKRRDSLRQISLSHLRLLVILGFFYYTATQGLIFLSLDFLPAATLSLLLNVTPVAVLIGGIIFLDEVPHRWQYTGLLVFLAGTVLYFLPQISGFSSGAMAIGLMIGVLTMLSNAVSALLGRSINRGLELDALIVTAVSMGIGSSLLLLISLLIEGVPVISARSWMIILWLASVHTALAFTLWNVTLRVLSAGESSIINNLMLVQIAVLAWVFLGEALTWIQIGALVLASAGIIVFQFRKD